MRARAICICRDEGVCGIVERALDGAGVMVDHHDTVPVAPAEPGEVALFVVDRESRRQAGDELRDLGAPVVVVGDDLDDDGLITLMLEAPVSHLVRDPSDRELGITSEKLVSGDLFGLEKYLAPGTRTFQRTVADDAEKRQAIGQVTAWAEASGARRPIVHRLASVIDELLMNALFDAPRESKPVISLDEGRRRAVLRWACDDRTLAVSVSDPFGAIRQRDVIDHVRRARDERGRPNPATLEDPGSGLGLYLVLANVASLIVNVDPGRQTEVVCLFDLARTSSRAIAGGVRSLHVFQAS
ncbi:MAG: hypothetical protein HOV81_05070 [Kofleriaceae bacterium]|nr:hypothetical protein [Kofleriaceae bacterium]